MNENRFWPLCVKLSELLCVPAPQFPFRQRSTMVLLFSPMGAHISLAPCSRITKESIASSVFVGNMSKQGSDTS